MTLAIDLASKAWAFSVMKLGEAITVIPGWLEFRTMYNRGAVFGFGKGGRWVFILASVLAVIFVLQLFARTKPHQRFVHIFLAFVLAGAAGNTYDRIVYHKVRDFIEITLTIKGLAVWPYVFNFADVILVVGVGLLMIGWITGRFETACSCPVAKPLVITDTEEQQSSQNQQD